MSACWWRKFLNFGMTDWLLKAVDIVEGDGGGSLGCYAMCVLLKTAAVDK